MKIWIIKSYVCNLKLSYLHFYFQVNFISYSLIGLLPALIMLRRGLPLCLYFTTNLETESDRNKIGRNKWGTDGRALTYGSIRQWHRPEGYRDSLWWRKNPSICSLELDGLLDLFTQAVCVHVDLYSLLYILYYITYCSPTLPFLPLL